MNTNSKNQAAKLQKDKSTEVISGRNLSEMQNIPGKIATDAPMSLQRVMSAPGAYSSADFLTLQQTLGNQAVGNLIQTKLKVGAPADKYERQADKIAREVTGMANPGTGIPSLQKFSDHGDSGLQVSSGFERNLNAQKNSGAELPGEVRSYMEPRFGTDFSDVRMHTDQNAGQMNQELNSRAFAHGNDIFFGQNEFKPGTGSGRQVIAHELAHTIQQTGNVQCLAKPDPREDITKISKMIGEAETKKISASSMHSQLKTMMEHRVADSIEEQIANNAIADLKTYYLDESIYPYMIYKATKTIRPTVSEQLMQTAQQKAGEEIDRYLAEKREITLENLFFTPDTHIEEYKELAGKAAEKDPQKLQSRVGKSLAKTASREAGAEVVQPVVQKILDTNNVKIDSSKSVGKIISGAWSAVEKGVKKSGKFARSSVVNSYISQSFEKMSRIAVCKSEIQTLYNKLSITHSTAEEAEANRKSAESYKDEIDVLEEQLVELKKLTTDEANESVKQELINNAKKLADDKVENARQKLGEMAGNMTKWPAPYNKTGQQKLIAEAETKARTKLEDKDFLRGALETTMEGGVNSRLTLMGKGINKLLPPGNEESNGKSYGLNFALDIPIPSDLTNILKGKLTFNFNGEISRKDNKTTVKTDISIGGGVEADALSHIATVSGGKASLKGSLLAKLGGFIEVQAADGEKAMNLLSYAFYRRFRESSVIPSGITNALWGMGGRSGEGKKKEADVWSRAIEETAFGDDDYAKLGVSLEGSASGSFKAGSFGVGLAATGSLKSAAKYSKESIEKTRRGGATEGMGSQKTTAEKTLDASGSVTFSLDIPNFSGSATVSGNMSKSDIAGQKSKTQSCEVSFSVSTAADKTAGEVIKKIALIGTTVKGIADVYVQRQTNKNAKTFEKYLENQKALPNQINDCFLRTSSMVRGLIAPGMTEGKITLEGKLNVSQKLTGKKPPTVTENKTEGEISLFLESEMDPAKMLSAGVASLKITQKERLFTVKFPGPELEIFGGGKLSKEPSATKGPAGLSLK